MSFFSLLLSFLSFMYTTKFLFFFFKREASTTTQPVVSKKKKKTLIKSTKNKDTSFFKLCKLTDQKKKKSDGYVSVPVAPT